MSGFRTSLVHSCHAADKNEKRPEKCKCRKLVTREIAVEMVNHGEADWLINYKGEVPIPTWDVVYKGITGKTPRSHTLEKAHLERGVERRQSLANQTWMSDEGAMAKNMDAAVMGDTEQAELFELYHDLEIQERYLLFRGCAKPLVELKKFSDTFGTVEGAEGKYVNDIIESGANKLKAEYVIDDPFEGRTLFPLIGWDQRTRY